MAVIAEDEVFGHGLGFEADTPRRRRVYGPLDLRRGAKPANWARGALTEGATEGHQILGALSGVLTSALPGGDPYMLEDPESGYGERFGQEFERTVRQLPEGDEAMRLIDAQRAEDERLGVGAGQEFLRGMTAPSLLGKITAAGKGALALGKAVGGLDLATIAPLFHGGSKLFKRFDTGFMSSGEGNQAFGWGHYFSEDPQVAGSYRNMGAEQMEASELYAKMERLGWDETAARGELENLRAFHQGEEFDPALFDTNEARLHEHGRFQRNPKAIAGIDEQLESIRSGDWKGEGNLYDVALDVDHEDLLDLDLPLSEQPPKVRAVLERLGVDPTADNGHDIYRELAYELGGDQAASEALAEAGIPGARYFDAFSRMEGEGSRNIVMYGDDLIDIRGVNEQPTLSGVKAGEPVKAASARAPKAAIARDQYVRENALAADPAKPAEEIFQEDLARVNEGAYLLKDKPGAAYQGAPKQVKTQADVRTMRNDYDRLVEIGAPYAKWYEDQGKFLESLLPDLTQQERMAYAIAITSPQASPVPNFQFALGEYLGGITGSQRAAKTAQMHEGYQEFLQTGVSGLGKKADSFFRAVNPATPNWIYGANDIWNARAWGYASKHKGKQFGMGPGGRDPVTKKAIPTKDSVSKQMHAWMDSEGVLAAQRARANDLEGRKDWMPHQAQAAAWVGARADEMVKSGKANTHAEAIEKMKGYYEEALPQHRVDFVEEQAPGIATGHVPEYHAMTPAEQEAYSRGGLAISEQGKHPLLQDMNLPATSSREAQGIYTPEGGVTEHNLAAAAGPLSSYKRTEGGKIISDVGREAMESATVMSAGLSGQQGAAFSMATKPPRGGLATGYDLTTPGGLTPDQALKVESAARARMGLTDASGFTMETGGTVRATQYEGMPLSTEQNELLGDMATEISDELGFDISAEEIVHSGEYNDLTQQWEGGEGSRQVYDLIEEKLQATPGFGNVDGEASRSWVQRQYDRDAALGTAREDLQNMRREYLKGGWGAVREFAANGGALPGVLLAFGVGLMGGDDGAPDA